MPKVVTILTSAPDAQWIKDAKASLADAGDYSVVVRTAPGCSATDHCSDVIIDSTKLEEGLSFFKQCHRCSPKARIFLATTEPGWEAIREVYRAGVNDVLRKHQIETDIADVFSIGTKELAIEAEVGKKILLADDNKDFRETWGEFLRNEGYVVVMAGSPSEAEAALGTEQIDLAILDVRLKDNDDELDLSGLEVASMAPSSTHVIIATDYPTVEIVRTAMRRLNGHRLADEFIYKPDPEDTFLEVVKRVLPPSPVNPSTSRDEEITKLYEKLASLRRDESLATEGGPEIEREFQKTFARLRELQLQEAEEFRAAAEARLLMPLGDGREILTRIE